MRVGVDGSRVYSVGYFAGGRWKRYTIGRVEDLTLAEARDAAKRIRARAQLGEDPQAEKVDQRRVGQTLGHLIRSFEEKHGPTMRPRSLGEFRRIAKHDLLPVLGLKHPEEITRADVRGLLDRIVRRGAPTQANRTLATIRSVFRWSVREDQLPPSADPTIGLRLPTAEKPRDRVYTNDELRAIFAAVPGTELEDLVPLLFYTAVRSEEARAARWADLDPDRAMWTIPAGATKGGDPHPVPLSPAAMRVVVRTREVQSDSELLLPRRDGPLLLLRSARSHGRSEQGHRTTAENRGRAEGLPAT